ncbi:pleckstrin homology domain-containing family M member 1 isoform X2 [Bacillus rossius redtenbacheri]|uniref:pleckstrin homology domain-containing family M member 1 isoform X2 n=1 Tax=Bacillus rossius redtenbacheri TaxID=93214 RepID=UPI002FDEB29A
MSSILRNVMALGNRESTVKDSLLKHLSNSVKQIQLGQTQPSSSCENEDHTNLCTVLEAIFIHGLKDTFITRVTQVIGSDPDLHPEPSFWGPLLIFSHREIIDQITVLNLVTTDVGRCRAWLRVVLNDCLLSSYFQAMRQDNKALLPYYKRSAFVRDPELLDVSQRLIQGVEGYTFCFVSNSSLLNMWTNPPLLLAGLWMPPMRTCPVASGVDIVNMLEEMPAPITEVAVPKKSSPMDLRQVVACNEEEALKIILGTPVSDDQMMENAKQNNVTGGFKGENGVDHRTTETDIRSTKEGHSEMKSSIEEGASSFGNSLVGRLGWSSSFDEVVDEETNTRECRSEERETPSGKASVVGVANCKVAVPRSPSEVQSYQSLLQSYNLLSGNYVKTPDLRDFLHKFENSSDSAADLTSNVEVDDPEFGSLVQQLGKLATERGLDAQDYMCRGCGHPIGISLSRARVCSFGGGYYCADCHTGEEWIIPARVIHNWDFKRYQVSRKAAAFLEEIQHHPLLDLKVLNPRLYVEAEEMSQLQTLRHKLNLLRAYLFTCREPVIEDLQKRVWPREYLYEHVHLYSVADLLQISSGVLAQLLRKVVAFAKNHVLTCWLCSQKGFICEVCNNPKVIYPFDVESSYRCAECSAVYHIGCLDATKPCPKCERRQKREDLLEVVSS